MKATRKVLAMGEDGPLPTPRLTRARAEVQRLIEAQIEKGRDLQATHLGSEQELTQARAANG